MKEKTGKKRSKKSFHVSDSLRQFFPKTSRMGFNVPTPWTHFPHIATSQKSATKVSSFDK
jgi:hypothetical protein